RSADHGRGVPGRGFATHAALAALRREGDRTPTPGALWRLLTRARSGGGNRRLGNGARPRQRLDRAAVSRADGGRSPWLPTREDYGNLHEQDDRRAAAP